LRTSWRGTRSVKVTIIIPVKGEGQQEINKPLYAQHISI
jgi:hypothetical protein